MTNNCERELRQFAHEIRRKDEHYCTHEIAIQTVELLKKTISKTEFQNAQELLTLIKKVGKILVNSSQIHSFLLGSLVRRILKIIRDEHLDLNDRQTQEEIIREPDSLHRIIKADNATHDFSKVVDQLKPSIIEHIGEFQMELDTSYEIIIQQTKKLINAKDIIMTIGHSKLVEQCLIEASKTIKFTLVIVDSPPSCQGEKFADILANRGIAIEVIHDSGVYSMMSRVDKVIIGTNAILGDGGLRCIIGSKNVAVSANYFSKPLIVLSPVYKLSTLYYEQCKEDQFHVFDSPAKIFPCGKGQDIISKINIIIPIFDHIPSEYITLIVTNSGGHPTSYVYRLLSELYNPDDNEF